MSTDRLPSQYRREIPAGAASLPAPHPIGLTGAVEMIKQIHFLLLPEIWEDVAARIEITLDTMSPDEDVRFMIDDIANRSAMQPTVRQNFLSAFAAMEAHLNAVKQVREGARHQIAASLGIVLSRA